MNNYSSHYHYRYAYVGNDPINKIDLWGLSASDNLPTETPPPGRGIACAGCHPPHVSDEQAQINKGIAQIMSGAVVYTVPESVMVAGMFVATGTENIVTNSDPDVESVNEENFIDSVVNFIGNLGSVWSAIGGIGASDD